MSLDNAVRNNVLDALNGVASFTAVVTPVKVRLMTANGNATTNGTQLATGAGSGSGAGYTSGGATVVMTGAVAGASGPTADLRWDNMPACTVVGVEVWDATPRRIQLGALTTPRTVASGESFELPAADVIETLS